MVELRYLEVFVLMGDDYGRYDKVLQYREGDYNIIERGTGKEIWCGTEWKNVPTVCAADAAIAASKQGNSKT